MTVPAIAAIETPPGAGADDSDGVSDAVFVGLDEVEVGAALVDEGESPFRQVFSNR